MAEHNEYDAFNMSQEEDIVECDKSKYVKKPGNRIKLKGDLDKKLKDYPSGFENAAKERWAKLTNMDCDKVKSIIDNTADAHFNRNDVNANTIGLHTMRNGSPLDGLVTLDVPLDIHNKTDAGTARMLFLPNFVRGRLDYLELIGIFDTHYDSDNLIPEQDFRSDNPDRYQLVKIPDRPSVYVLKYVAK